jgi:hypothetical protein
MIVGISSTSTQIVKLYLKMMQIRKLVVVVNSSVQQLPSETKYR